MFESLDERIRQDEKGKTSTRERVVLWLTISAASIVVFGGLILAVQKFQ